MLEAYLGEETFRAGVNAYLKQHQYANATADDFWDAQAKTSKKPVDKIMPTWVKQAGVPIINVKAQCSGNSTSVTLAQQRYYFDRAKFEAPNDQLWQIPLCLKGSAQWQGREVRTPDQEGRDLHAAGLLDLGSGQCGRDWLLPHWLPAGCGSGPGERCRDQADSRRANRFAERHLGFGASGARTGRRLSRLRARSAVGPQPRRAGRRSRPAQLHRPVPGER